VAPDAGDAAPDAVTVATVTAGAEPEPAVAAAMPSTDEPAAPSA
jgi:hypothetical protein